MIVSEGLDLNNMIFDQIRVVEVQIDKYFDKYIKIEEVDVFVIVFIDEYWDILFCVGKWNKKKEELY